MPRNNKKMTRNKAPRLDGRGRNIPDGSGQSRKQEVSGPAREQNVSHGPAERPLAAQGPGNAPQAPEAGKEHFSRPEILAPAGTMQAALAGLAAGADALYLGLKHFSARMQAENFSTSELSALADMAHRENRRIYVAMNTLVKPGETAQAYRLLLRLVHAVEPDALIVQDPAFFDLARQAGFRGALHLSTLANVTHPQALAAARSLGAERVILPRELSLDEIRLMNQACPEGLALELFVHGALCYCVSGRCWWSSYMGGKSGLRGRCVQPCRRVYRQKGREGRFFSCLDLSLGSAVRSLLALEHVRSWKIEGRKKSPHYVYHVTRAYRMLLDCPDSPEVRREAERLLEAALGRPGTKALFSGADSQGVTGTQTARQTRTGSGLLAGLTGRTAEGKYVLKPRFALFPKDLVRVGHEDEPWHCLFSPPRATAGQEFVMPLPRGKRPKPGTPVFLIDRKEPGLAALLAERGRELERLRARRKDAYSPGEQVPVPPVPFRGNVRKQEVRLLGFLPHGRQGKTTTGPGAVQGLWLSPKALRELSRTLYARISWWLPPVIWPDEEDAWSRLIVAALRGGARNFVCNAPWQISLFRDAGTLSLTAGPFCNIANAAALGVLRDMGFHAAVISPELGHEDILALPGQSPLPLGIVLSGFWPVGLTRHRADPLKTREGFQSPRGEEFWLRRYGRNLWIYPAWPLDLTAHREELERAGYAVFVHIEEHPPATLTRIARPGEFNWNTGLL